MENVEKQAFVTVWAPAQISFTYWVLREFQNSGIKRAYFIARDGYMSYLIAKKTIKNLGLSIDCRYLEGSRYAWRMAEFALPEVDPLEKVCIGGVNVSTRTILKRGGLTETEQKEIVSLLKSQSSEYTNIDKPLSYAKIVDFKKHLSKCGKFTEYIRMHAKETYDNTIGYLKQEGLFDDIPIAIVDSGWAGTMQQTLTRLLISGGKNFTQSIQGYYFGLYELPIEACSNDYHCFFFRPYKDISRKVNFSNCLFEAVCSAPEGMTVGYRFEGKYIPIRETSYNLNSDRIMKNIEWLLQLIEDKEHLEQYNIPVYELKQRLKKLMSRPSKDEAAVFGSYFFTDDVLSDNIGHVAIELNESEVKNLHAVRRILIMKGLLKKSLKDTPWPEGSIVRNGRNQGWHLFCNRIYKYLIYIRKCIYQRMRK